MFLHIGLNTVLDVKDIIAVIDIENSDTTSIGDYCNEEAAQISGRQPKTLIITGDSKHRATYLSPISSLTLKKRIG